MKACKKSYYSWILVLALLLCGREGGAATTITLTAPNVGGTYSPADSVLMRWTSSNTKPSDQIVLSMRRDSSSSLKEPDDVNWFRFSGNTPNDGQQSVVIPDSVAEARDWRFCVRHVKSAAYDCSDAPFTLVYRHYYMKVSSIGDQSVNKPFSVSIEAHNDSGALVPSFNGQIYLTLAGPGEISPNRITMTSGRAVSKVKIDTPSQNSRIRCQGLGSGGESNTFKVKGAGTGKLQGRVVDEDGNPLSGITIEVALTDSNKVSSLRQDDYNNSGEVRLKTDADGKYEAFLPAGSYSTVGVGSDNKMTLMQNYEVSASRLVQSCEVLLPRYIKKPVIFIPGIMGSDTVGRHDIYPSLPKAYPAEQSDLMIFNPFVDFVDIVGWKTLRNKLKEDYSIFECPYDWRMSLRYGYNYSDSNRASKTITSYRKYLMPVIDYAKKISGYDKVDIVAHSMGGLLVRSYIQSEEYRNDIDKFVMVGTPNHGSVMSYFMWEGGDSLGSDRWYTKTPDLLYFYTFVTNGLYNTTNGVYIVSLKKKRLEYLISRSEIRNFIHTMVPSLQQLMPTFKCLDVLNDDPDKGLSTVENQINKNQWLITLNGNVNLNRMSKNGGSVKTIVFASRDVDTLSSIGVMPSNDDLYEDGKPGEGFDGSPQLFWKKGDGTVLYSESAVIPSIDCASGLKGEHKSLVKSFADEIAAFLIGRAKANLPLQSSSSETLGAVALGVAVEGRVAPLLTDPQGRKLGFDDALQKSYQEIGDSKLSKYDKRAGLLIPSPASGTYELNLNGPISEQASLILTYIAEKGSESQRQTIFYSGSAQTLHFTLNPEASPKIVINPPINAPEKLECRKEKDNTTRLVWSPVEEGGPASYKIYSRLDNQPSFTLVKTVPANQTEYVTTHPWAKPVRVYAVSAVNASGQEGLLSPYAENQAHLLTQFSAAPLSGNAPLTVQFTDQSSGDPVSWLWEFGDGKKSTERNPSHVYSGSGKYAVSLTVKNAKDMDQQRKDGYIVVKQYTDNGDGTVTDNKTGLIWQQADDGIKRSRDAAITYCEALDLGGYVDWRLPFEEPELCSIKDEDYQDPTINPIFNAKSDFYWSMSYIESCLPPPPLHPQNDELSKGYFSAYAGSGVLPITPQEARSCGWACVDHSFWSVDFSGTYDGCCLPESSGPSAEFYVRCVRGEMHY